MVGICTAMIVARSWHKRNWRAIMYDNYPEEPLMAKHKKPGSNEYLRRAPANYTEYGKSKWWNSRRWAYWQDHERRCMACATESAAVKIDIHHMTYRHVGCEPDDDLIGLCRDCHQAVHAAKGGNDWTLREATQAIINAGPIPQGLKLYVLRPGRRLNPPPLPEWIPREPVKVKGPSRAGATTKSAGRTRGQRKRDARRKREAAANTPEALALAEEHAARWSRDGTGA